MRYSMYALAAAGLLAAAPAFAQSVAPARSVQLSKVILDTTTPVKGKLKGGTLCVFPQAMKLPETKKSQDYERYDGLFSERMKTAGITTVTTSGDLFATESDANKADYMIGAVIKPDTVNLCSSVNGEKGNVTLAVDWQIYDRAAKKVVATLTTTGYGVQEKFAQDGLTQMWNRAFVANLGALLEKGEIQKYTGGTVPVAAAK